MFLKKFQNYIACLLLLFLVPGICSALSSDVQFKSAEIALHENNMTGYYHLKSKLKSYPLYPYLLYQEIIHNFRGFKPKTIENVLTQYKGTYWEKILRSSWLNYLGETHQWNLYSNIYRKNSSTRQVCWYLHAEYIEGQQSPSLKKFTPIWLSGDALPSSCNYMIEKWKGSGYDTNKTKWKRLEMAMENSNTPLATYISEMLPHYDQRYFNAWLNARKNPELELTNFYKKFHNFHYFDFAFKNIMARYIEIKPNQAERYWLQENYTKKLNIKLVDFIGGTIGLNLARNFDLSGLKWLKSAKYKTNPMWAWQARLAIRYAKWETVILTIENMPKKLSNKNEWRYWLGRSLLNTNQEKAANNIFKELSKLPTFYGYMSADEIDKPYALSSKLHEAPYYLRKKFKSSKILKQIRALNNLKYYNLANNLWNFELHSYSKEMRLAAAHILANVDDVYLSMQAYSKSGFGNENLAEYFPIVYGREVEEISSHYNINAAWIFSLMRQESFFDPQARSYVGALGLMQVMPATANFIAHRYRIPYRGPFSLYSPSTNIQIGIANADFIKNLFHSNYVLATASYNAGQGNVAKLLPKHATMSSIRWIDTVPFHQTRNYLRKVLENFVAYEVVLLGNKNFRLKNILKPITPYS